MLKFVTDLFTGNYKILAWFILAIILIYIPAWFIYLHLRKRKSEVFLSKYPHAAKVHILHGELTGNLTVHSVDGEKPVLDSERTAMYLYLTPGIHTLELAYQWTEVAPFEQVYGLNKTMNGKNVSIRVSIEVGRHYTLGYDKKRETYRLKVVTPHPARV
ncbi:hypothetical protein [Methanobrevibacter curvatus]|uniref:Uncharacterized protein n=1 Tax=Methanobrevibacter curvatus TaxID=49547 RepID=A0A166BAN1_9EURY|nr:hypothetical protein [Methanobrevibacter curvatus]KZX13089.1 hypothetical protein MBCUR_07770 [Methanobrevibacter curvatus]